jgi:hypothetical protein
MPGGLPGAAIGALGVQEVVLQVDGQERGPFRIEFVAHVRPPPRGAMIVLPKASTRPRQAGVDQDGRVGLHEDRGPVDFRADRQGQPVVDRRLVPGIAEMHLAAAAAGRLDAAAHRRESAEVEFRPPPDHGGAQVHHPTRAVLQKPSVGRHVGRVEGGVDLRHGGGRDGAALHPDGKGHGDGVGLTDIGHVQFEDRLARLELDFAASSRARPSSTCAASRPAARRCRDPPSGC